MKNFLLWSFSVLKYDMKLIIIIIIIKIVIGTYLSNSLTMK